MEEEVTPLQSEYAKSRKQFENTKRKHIAAVTVQINVAFDALFAALPKQKGDLLKQLHGIGLQYDDAENEGNDDGY